MRSEIAPGETAAWFAIHAEIARVDTGHRARFDISPDRIGRLAIELLVVLLRIGALWRRRGRSTLSPLSIGFDPPNV